MSGVDVGTAYLTVVPSAKGFSRRLSSEIGGGMSTAGSRAGSQAAESFASKFTSGVKTAAKVGAIAIGASFAGLGIAGAKMGLEIAAGNEQAEISFTTMLGSAEKAQSFLSDMQKFAASTPFEFPELQTAASSLISAGINADKVIPIMRTLGDVTSGMGTGSEGVQRATIALQQMSAAGRITGEDLNQLRDAGIPVYDLLAKATGKSKEEVVKLAQAGKLGKKELGQMMTALETGKGLERFSGLMDKQSQSLTGMISTFKDTLGQGLANAIKPAIPLIKDGLTGASNLLAKVLPRLGQGLAGIVEIFTKGRVGENFAKAFKIEDESKFADFLFGIRDAFKALRAGFSGDVSSYDGFLGVIAKIGDAFGAGLDKAKAFIGQIRSGEGAGGAFRDGLTKVFEYLKGAIPPIVDSAKKLWPPLRDIAKQLFAASESGGASMFGLLKAALAALPGILESIAPLLEGVAKWMGENKDIVAALVVGLTAGITAFKVITGIVKAYTIVQGLLNIVLAANPIGIVVIAIAALAAGLIYAYKNSETFRNVVDGAFKAIAAAGRWLWNSVLAPVIRFIVGGFADVADHVGDFLDALSNIPGFGWAKDAASKMHGAADKARELATAITDIPDDTQIKVTTTYVFKDQGKRLAAANDRKLIVNGIDGNRASGGPVRAGGMYAVGDNPDGSWNRTTELLVPNRSGTVVNQEQIAAALGAGRNAGLSQSDIDRLAYAFSQVQVKASISAHSVSQALVAGM